jgi:hypothetical protein
LPDDRLLILTPDAATYAALAADAGLDDLEIHAATEVDQARTAAAGCNVVLGVPALVAGLLDAMPRLGWVQSTYAGVDALCRPGLRRDYTLTGLRGIFGALMREYVLGWILALERDLFEARQLQLRGRPWGSAVSARSARRWPGRVPRSACVWSATDVRRRRVPRSTGSTAGMSFRRSLPSPITWSWCCRTRQRPPACSTVTPWPR